MDLLLVAAAAAFAVLPLWREHRRGAVARAPLAAALLGAAAVVVAAASWPAADTTPPADRPLEVAGRGYVGSRTCRSCHPDQHASWHDSYHRTMTQVATRESIAAQFDALELDWFGKRVALRWQGDRLHVAFERGGREPAAVARPVEQVTGSHHLQVLWYSTGEGRELAPVPMVYRIDERQWLPLNAVFVLPPEFRDPPEPGTWNVNCHMCHATAVEPRVDVGRCDTQVAELGIACEACHGPGEAHVAANRSPLRRYALHLGGGRDDTIVDPKDLPAERSAQVCGQCHSVNILKLQHVASWREHGLPYRPGDDLAATRRILDPGDRDNPEARRQLQQNPLLFANAFWPDGEIRLSGREYNGLLRSPCYAHGDEARRMTCLSCHAMHAAPGQARDEWKDDQLAPGMRGNGACTQCHGELQDDAALTAHTHHAADSAGSACYNCHMGFTSFGLMKAMRSHTVSSPSVQRELATGRPNACNQCHLDRTLQWTAEHLASRYGIAPPQLDDDQQDVAAGVRWLLAGDAGQRALAAWSFGWTDAQRAAGTEWMAPYLAQLLADPYFVVRFVALRSLRTLPGGAPGDGAGGVATALAGHDWLGAEAAGRAAARAVQDTWQAQWQARRKAGPAVSGRPALLLDERGLLREPFERLYARRDDRPVYLAE